MSSAWEQVSSVVKLLQSRHSRIMGTVAGVLLPGVYFRKAPDSLVCIYSMLNHGEKTK
jgi:hypothetical protein